MTRKKLSFSWFFFNTLLVLAAAFFFRIFYVTNPWTTVSLWSLVGVYYLIVLMKFLFLGRKRSMSGAYALFYLGCALILVFLVWLGNMFLKIFNPMFSHLGFDFQFGNLFPSVWNFACSVPALLCGLILLAAGVLWEHNDSYTKSLRNALLSGK